MSAYVTDPGLLCRLSRMLPADLPPTACHAYTVLVVHAGEECVAWPGQKTLAGEMHVSLDTAYRAVRLLRDRGLIAVSPGGGRRSSVYRFVDFRDPSELSTPPAPTRGLDSLDPAPTRGQPPRQTRRPPAPTRGEVQRRTIEKHAHEPLAVDDPVAAAAAAQEFFASIQRPRMTEAERNAAGARAWARARARFTDATQT